MYMYSPVKVSFVYNVLARLLFRYFKISFASYMYMVLIISCPMFTILSPEVFPAESIYSYSNLLSVMWFSADSINTVLVLDNIFVLHLHSTCT